jgi:hypothetical protein
MTRPFCRTHQSHWCPCSSPWLYEPPFVGVADGQKHARAWDEPRSPWRSQAKRLKRVKRVEFVQLTLESELP